MRRIVSSVHTGKRGKNWKMMKQRMLQMMKGKQKEVVGIWMVERIRMHMETESRMTSGGVGMTTKF